MELFDSAFEYCGLDTITFGDGGTVFVPNSNKFFQCPQISTINFNGTKGMWIEITQGGEWYDGVADITVNCIDGKLDKWGNEID